MSWTKQQSCFIFKSTGVSACSLATRSVSMFPWQRDLLPCSSSWGYGVSPAHLDRSKATEDIRDRHHPFYVTCQRTAKCWVTETKKCPATPYLPVPSALRDSIATNSFHPYLASTCFKPEVLFYFRRELIRIHPLKGKQNWAYRKGNKFYTE